MSLDAIGIACLDLEKTAFFYEALGVSFKKFGEGHMEGRTSSGVRLMLDSIELLKEINPNFKEPKDSGITLCFLQNSPTEVDQRHKALIDLGFISVKEPWDAFWGQRYSSILDPNGNQVDLFASLES